MPLKGYPHNLWNDSEILTITKNRSGVVAFIDGHNHTGNHIYKKGVHYITVFGMVDTQISSDAIPNIYYDSLFLQGYGKQESIHITLEAALG
jgi:hypothetical protein